MGLCNAGELLAKTTNITIDDRDSCTKIRFNRDPTLNTVPELEEKKPMKKTALFAAIALSLAAANVSASTKAEASKAILDAGDAVNAAAAVRGEWRDSWKTIGKAKAAYKKGDYEAAMKLANKAKNEGMNGQKQAEAEKNAGIPQYVYDMVKK
jgi:peptidyl-tRNA hydrolase